MGKIYLSVVIPAYNEEKNLRRGALAEVYNYLKNQQFSWEVLVVDDGSSDATFKLANAFVKNHRGFEAIKEPHRGKGGTVIAGMLAASGDYILFTDMDQATPIDQFDKFLPKFKEGYDVVIGSRTGRKGAPLFRKIMAYGFSILRLLVLRLPFKDTQCGFKAFTQTAAKAIFERMKVFKERESVKGYSVTAGFDLEVLYIARKLKLKIVEIPVEWSIKTTRLNPVKDSLLGLRDLINVRINAVLGRYRV